MKTAIILLVLLVVLGGGGYVGWQQMGDSSSETAEGSDGEASFFNEEPKFVELDLLTAPFVRGGKFVQYVVLVINLEVSDADGVDEVRAVMPRLRDAFVTELHTMATMRNPEQKMLNMVAIAHDFDLPITAIGRITEGRGVSALDESGDRIDVASSGWRHF